ncbi:hypothetical protein CRE_03524 [Caenorhabditis remanei]|uniref:Domain of unknown function DB domain-containing protein n=1 Tax=Caenorhabditis remanei TaxID=31234 RepID=E3NN05_CAERE|nr:hypothetical protein CRE_03524 [Caenorhabditis remanei]
MRLQSVLDLELLQGIVEADLYQTTQKHLLQPLLIFLLSTTVSSQLSCHRIPTSFCCTTRIRDQCPEQCATVQCGTEFLHNLFSTDGSRKPASVSGAHDGNANIGGTGSGDLQRGFGGVEPLAPPQPSFFSQTPPPTPPPAPSVISNSGDVFARSRKEISTTPDFEQQSGTVATLSVINKLDLTNSGDHNGREKEPQIRLEGNTKDLSVESSAVVIVSRTTVAPGVTNKVSVIPFCPLHFTVPPKNGPPGVSPPPAPGGQYGVAPDFTPCVSNEIASKSLLECCKRKNLPAGCQQLCRYDITQAEIRAAMDRGQCGIFNVAPFLECASQGKDNSECCRLRGIVQKTGPQCEQFCRPTQGLSALGVQHIVCGNAVGDMLHCHHSGVRI